MKDISNINHKKKEESHKGTTIVEPSDQRRSLRRELLQMKKRGARLQLQKT